MTRSPLGQPQAPVENMEGMSRREKREKFIAVQKQLSRMPRPKKPNHIPAQYVTVEKTPLEVEVKDN